MVIGDPPMNGDPGWSKVDWPGRRSYPKTAGRREAILGEPPVATVTYAAVTSAGAPARPTMGVAMKTLLNEIRRTPLLWLLAFVPVLFAGERLAPESHTLLFVLSILALVPLAALLSHATESVAARTGDAVGGLLNATLGNLTELVIALTALPAGEYMLVKASVAGA